MGREWKGVRAASESSIEINFRYKGQLCRERIKLKPTPTNLTRAERFRAAVVLAIENGTFDYSVSFPDSPRVEKFCPPQIKTNVGHYFEQWIARQKAHLKSSTWTDYERIVRGQILPTFGNLDLSEINKLILRQWCADIESSNKRIANILSVFRHGLQSALEDGMVLTNELHGFSYRRKELIKTSDDVDPFTKEEQVLLLAALTGQARNLVQFALWTGLRTSEYIALDWSDIDMKAATCSVSKALTQNADNPEAPKTRSGVRVVKLLPPALAALKDQKQHTFLQGREVFQNPLTLKRYTGDKQVRVMMQAAMKKAGVRVRRAYMTRHTYASMMVSSGEPEMWVAQQMGHSDIGMIRRNYGRWMPEAAPDAGQKAVRTFG